VFQGQADGYINAYGASDGRKAWSFYAATAALGTPITFSVGKQQYVAILTGPLNGAPGGFGSAAARFGWDSRVHPRRLLAFRAGWQGQTTTHAAADLRQAARCPGNDGRRCAGEGRHPAMVALPALPRPGARWRAARRRTCAPR
jgi:hypothetical protein